MRRAVFGVTSALALAALAGCGHSGGPAAYLGSNATEVVFIQWQQSSSGQLQGTIFDDQASGTAPGKTIAATSSPFTGSVNGGSVTLHFSGFLGIQANVAGSLSGNTLTLQIPQSGGTIQQDTFTAASVSAFNTAVATLRNRIHNANTVAAQAQAAAKAQGLTAAKQQAAINTTADATAHAACNQYRGSWSSPGTVNYTADGYTFSILGGPQDTACQNVSYLGSDDASYYVTINFTANGTPQPAGSGTGTATQAECSRGYYPDQSAGQTSQPPGNWSSVLGICLTKG
jgi:hypothetical protein